MLITETLHRIGTISKKTLHKLIKLIQNIKFTIGGIMISIEDWQLRRFEKKMKKLKPKLLEKWYNTQYEEIEQRLEQEYAEELERSHTAEWDLGNKLRATANERDKYKNKYEPIQEAQDKTLDKIEKVAQEKGQLKQEVKQLNSDIKELTTQTED